jgi:hypothetical protein
MKVSTVNDSRLAAMLQLLNKIPDCDRNEGASDTYFEGS